MRDSGYLVSRDSYPVSRISFPSPPSARLSCILAVRTALANLVPFGFHTGLVRTVKGVSSLLVLGSSLLDLLLVLLFSFSLVHHARPTANTGTDRRSLPCIATNGTANCAERGTTHRAVQRTAA